MASFMNSILSMATLLLLSFLCFSLSVSGQTASPPISTPTPAPAPSPAFVNLTDLLTVAGPFHTFLNNLITTKVIDTFQNQANNTDDQGITIFVPKDESFSSLKTPSLSNLTQEQLKSLFLFHALPKYYSLADFKNLSQVGPVPTFAGGDYTLNFSDASGTVRLNSGWSVTKVSSSVYSTDPIAVYQVDKVLLPVAIFGTDIPPAAAPAPVPEIAPASDVPGGKDNGSSPTSSPGSSSSERIYGGLSVLLAIASGVVVVGRSNFN